jgi:M6 family metalloprotease-like protein
MKLVLDTSMDWVRMPKTAAHYKKAFWADKINDAIDLVDPTVDFSKYDMVLFYISKNNKITTEAGALPGFPDRQPDGLSQIRGVYLGNDGWRQKGQHAAVTIHETLHVMGLPDLYMPNRDGSKNVGVFDQMSEYLPKLGSRLFYWNRWKLGWLEDSQIFCLDPEVSQTLTINARNARNNLWVIPVNQRTVAVIQPWIVGRTIRAIAYEVDVKDFVWTSAPQRGSGESPIQMLRPKRAGSAPKTFINRNLEVVLRSKDVIETNYARLNISGGKNELRISISPK